MNLALGKKINHGGYKVSRWNMDNIVIRRDPAGNIKTDKEKSTEKIDGAAALIMALDRAIRCGNDSGESVYDERGSCVQDAAHFFMAKRILYCILIILVYTK